MTNENSDIVAFGITSSGGMVGNLNVTTLTLRLFGYDLSIPIS